MTIGERLSGRRFLISDRDTKFSAAFDGGFTSEGLRVLRTPVRARQANAYRTLGRNRPARLPRLDPEGCL
jgi:putative transposase